MLVSLAAEFLVLLVILAIALPYSTTIFPVIYYVAVCGVPAIITWTYFRRPS